MEEHRNSFVYNLLWVQPEIFMALMGFEPITLSANCVIQSHQAIWLVFHNILGDKTLKLFCVECYGEYYSPTTMEPLDFCNTVDFQTKACNIMA